MMKRQDDRQREFGTVAWLPLVLLPVVCCAAPLLLIGAGSLGLAAMVGWLADPWIQLGAVLVLGAGLLGWWRRRRAAACAMPDRRALPAQSGRSGRSER